MAMADVAGVLAGVVAAQAGPPGEFPFPKTPAIKAELTNVAGNWPVVLKHHLDDFVLPQYSAIPATAVPPKAGVAAVAWNTIAQVGKVVRNESAVGYVPPATNNLPLAQFDRFDYKLHQLQENPPGDIAAGFQLFKDYFASNPKTVPATAFTNQDTAVRSIRNLAAFEALCIRLASAVSGAARAGVSLSEALAFWRTEGDLLVPWSNQRRTGSAPTGDFIAMISLGDHTADVLFSMKRGMWSLTYNRLPGILRLPVNAAETVIVENACRLLALIQWWVIAAGVDFFWQPPQVPVDLLNRPATVGNLATFLNDNHKARFGAAGDNRAALVAECNSVLDDLTVQLPGAVTQRVIVTPSNPVRLMSLMLGEALLFSELDSVGGRGPVIAPVPELKYLSYHCQDTRHRTDETRDKFTLMLVSAAVSAARGPAGPLKTSLQPLANDPAFPKPADLKDISAVSGNVVGDTSGHQTGYQKLKDAGWLNPADLKLLAQFMLTATPAQWSGWADLRGNMARHRKLLGYYEKLLS